MFGGRGVERPVAILVSAGEEAHGRLSQHEVQEGQGEHPHWERAAEDHSHAGQDSVLRGQNRCFMKQIVITLLRVENVKACCQEKARYVANKSFEKLNKKKGIIYILWGVYTNNTTNLVSTFGLRPKNGVGSKALGLLVVVIWSSIFNFLIWWVSPLLAMWWSRQVSSIQNQSAAPLSPPPPPYVFDKHVTVSEDLFTMSNAAIRVVGLVTWGMTEESNDDE